MTPLGVQPAATTLGYGRAGVLVGAFSLLLSQPFPSASISPIPARAISAPGTALLKGPGSPSPCPAFFFLVCDGTDSHVPRLASRRCPCPPRYRVCRQRLSSEKRLRQGAAAGSTPEIWLLTKGRISASKTSPGGETVHGVGCSACAFDRSLLGRTLREKRLWESEVQQGARALRGAPEPLGSGLSRPAQTLVGRFAPFWLIWDIWDVSMFASPLRQGLGTSAKAPARRRPLQGVVSGASQPAPVPASVNPAPSPVPVRGALRFWVTAQGSEASTRN